MHILMPERADLKAVLLLPVNMRQLLGGADAPSKGAQNHVRTAVSPAVGHVAQCRARGHVEE